MTVYVNVSQTLDLLMTSCCYATKLPVDLCARTLSYMIDVLGWSETESSWSSAVDAGYRSASGNLEVVVRRISDSRATGGALLCHL